jgi:hypothetical protein
MTKRQHELFPEIPSEKKYLSDYPELFAEWHPTKNGKNLPEDFLHGSNKKVWWLCKNGHEWQQTGDKVKRLVSHELCPKCRSSKT